MKIAIIGRGKTGAKVAELVPAAHRFGPFGRDDTPNAEDIASCDAAIVFVPGASFLELIPTLLAAKIPVVTGATGFVWPQEFSAQLRSENLVWIHGDNFSLGMNMLLLIADELQKFSTMVESASFAILEKHHSQKVDAPSGSAKALAARFESAIPIDSVREGDIVGYHELRLKCPAEKITIAHEATDRVLFAQGAVWAANYLLKNATLPTGNAKLTPGLYNFNDIFAQQLRSKQTFG